MTRDEEICKAAEEFAFSDKTESSYFHDAINDFYYGAKWADKTMLDKACKWLYEELGDGFYFYDAVVSKSFTNTQDFINAFKKAMEEQ